MTNAQPFAIISRLSVLVMIGIFLITSGGITHSYGVSPADETALIDQANTADAAAQDALDLSRATQAEASNQLDELLEFNKFPDPDTNALSNLRRLTHAVNLMFDPSAEKKTTQDRLLDAQAKLVDALKKLNAAKTALDAATTSPAIEAAKLSVKDKIALVKPQLDATGATAPAITALVTKLNETLGAVYLKVAALAKAADDQVSLLNKNVTEPNDLLTLLQKTLGDIPALIQFDIDLQDAWANLSSELKRVVSDHDTKAKPVDAAITKLDTSVATMAAGLNQQVGILAKYTQAHDAEVITTAETFKSDPSAHETEALNAIKDAARVAAAMENINGTVATIGAQADAAGLAGFDKTKAQSAQKDLIDKVKHLRLSAAALQELLSGDRSLWITEKIRLYYFTDIPRLVQTLNSEARVTGGDPDARRRATDRIEKLRAAEDAQSEASSKVAGLKKQVASLTQQLEQAKAELGAANFLAEKTASKDAELNRRPAGDVSAERKALSLEEKNKRERDRVAAQERSDKLNDENSGLNAQLATAKADLEIAQEAFERASNATIRAAQAESAAFANARDNAPFWLAPAVATSSDPARRVEISSSTSGENAIFVRGRREDVVKVQDIVAALDEPAPQARMTLWKLELNSDATNKGAEKFNKSLEIVEQELASTRAKIASALSLLLESINVEAELAALKKGEEDQKRSDVDKEKDRKDCLERDIYTHYDFPLVPKKEEDDLSGRIQRLRRYALYSKQVQKELGVEFLNELGFDNPKQFGLKDPAAATTLNEALIILLLTDRVHRKNIIDRFENALQTQLEPVTSVESSPTENKTIRALKPFARLRSMLAIDPLPPVSGMPAISIPTDTEVTRQQEELIYALRGLLLRHLVGRLQGLQKRIDLFVALEHKGKGPPINDREGRSGQEEILYQCLKEKLPKIFDTIHDEFPISAFAALKGYVKLVDSPEGTVGLQEYEIDNRGKRPKGPVQVFSLRPSPARVAAADGMLDVFTKAFEDDVDREYVQPMLRDLRLKLKTTGIGFGTIQRTSVLATNRLVARVDPRATAELAVGEETNLLQGLQQISQLTLAGQTTGALGILKTLQAQSNEKDTAEIYGITSGSAFQVTPIFDPTGQALRFRFDFVDTTLVRDPKGTTNPRLPRVERHTVNTEVQLANLEIREVSRFESDSKIGLPTTYKGGLPILRDIPGVRPIPFIGWFVRRKGSNAIAQRSLIFAQTTMSPTIGDILDLLDTSLQRR